MADLDAADLSRGPEVRWYAGGAITHDTETGTASVSLSGKADYGLIVVLVNGVQVAFTATGNEADGITSITVAGSVAASDVVDVYYVDIDSSTLTHLTSAEDFKLSAKADVQKKAVHGQPNKIVITGTTEYSGSFSMLFVNAAFRALFMGDRTTGPGTGEHVWSSKASSFKKIGCLVGKKYNSVGTITKKWALVGVTANSLDVDFPTEDVYVDSLNVDVDFPIVWEGATS